MKKWIKALGISIGLLLGALAFGIIVTIYPIVGFVSLVLFAIAVLTIVVWFML